MHRGPGSYRVGPGHAQTKPGAYRLLKSGCKFLTGLFSCFPLLQDHVRRVRRELLLHNDHSKSIHDQEPVGFATAQKKNTHSEHRNAMIMLYPLIIAKKDRIKNRGCDLERTKARSCPYSTGLMISPSSCLSMLFGSMTRQENTIGNVEFTLTSPTAIKRH